MDDVKNNVLEFKRWWLGQKAPIDTHLDNMAASIGGEDKLIEFLKMRFNLTEKPKSDNLLEEFKISNW